MINDFIAVINERLDAEHANASKQLHSLNKYDEASQQNIVATLLEYACQYQNIGFIKAAKKLLATIPPAYLSKVLEAAIQKKLDLNKEWEYRRLMEYLKGFQADLFFKYVYSGLASTNAEIREAAEFFKNQSFSC